MSHMLSGCWRILSGCQVYNWGIQYHLCSTYRGLWGLVVVRVGGCPAVVTQWQSIGGSTQRCPGFDSQRLPAFSLLHHSTLIQVFFHSQTLDLLLQFIDQAVHVAIQDRSTAACVFWMLLSWIKTSYLTELLSLMWDSSLHLSVTSLQLLKPVIVWNMFYEVDYSVYRRSGKFYVKNSLPENFSCC